MTVITLGLLISLVYCHCYDYCYYYYYDVTNIQVNPPFTQITRCEQGFVLETRSRSAVAFFRTPSSHLWLIAQPILSFMHGVLSKKNHYYHYL